MKIIKHCSQTFPTTATGFLVGMDRNANLEVTNAFPFPTVDLPQTDGHHDSNAASNLAAAAPRAKANGSYQTEMIKKLREVNVDANNTGWYTSANLGNFVTMTFIENQYHYQRELNERTVAMVYDVSRSSQGSLSLRAFRLSPTFMTAFKESKFTTERYDMEFPAQLKTDIDNVVLQPSEIKFPLSRHSPRTSAPDPQFSSPHLIPPFSSKSNPIRGSAKSPTA